MKSIKTYVPVIIAVRSGTDNINAFSELINPLICIANKPIICFSLEYLTINEFEGSFRNSLNHFTFKKQLVHVISLF